MSLKSKVGQRFKYYDLIIYADRGSNSARGLADTISCRRWRAGMPDRYARRPAFFKGFKEPIIVNWGTTTPPEWASIQHALALSKQKGLILNPFDAVKAALNKITTLQILDDKGVPCLKWTTKPEEVQKWLQKEHKVFVRKTVVGQGGAGISLLSEGAAVPTAPLYTRNFPKTHEFRVHVAFGKVIDFTEKRARTNEEGRVVADDRLIRNHDNGWVFAHTLSRLSGDDRKSIDSLGIAAVAALGLHFGAVDVLAILDTPETGGRLKKAVVCEVNTGPGLENTQTIEAYKKAFEDYRGSVRSPRAAPAVPPGTVPQPSSGQHGGV